MVSGNPKHILVTVLDWGLGHATRCIPLVRNLLAKNCRVSIAGSGPSLALLKLEFPELSFHEISPYKITYPVHHFFFFHFLFLSPRILKVISAEKKEIERLVKIHRFNAIISDNRYGCYAKQVKSVLMTHQTNIQLPGWMAWSKKLVNLINHRLVKRFDMCWVPDLPGSRFSGKLTATPNLPLKWVGILSRFTSNEIGVEDKHILGLVSGPEPQRTIFEKILIREMKKTNQPGVLLRGLPQAVANETRDGNIILINHASSPELQRIISKADVVISRSGFSTIMDMIALGKKRVIFVPTPGQTEQEYLAVEMNERKMALSQSQQSFNLPEAMLKLNDYTGFDASECRPVLLDVAIQDLLQLI
jgi:uncharacterized protein (TIGR00661 family)